MATPTIIRRGAVVLVQFPFSDLTQAKLRPAVVLADSGRRDFVLLQLTSRPYSDPKAVQLTEKSFEAGSLDRISYARPGKLFTANESLFEHTVGNLTLAAMDEVTAAVIQLLRSGR